MVDSAGGGRGITFSATCFLTISNLSTLFFSFGLNNRKATTLRDVVNVQRRRQRGGPRQG